MAELTNELVAILDFGSQYTQLIARRVRENSVYCEIFPHRVDATELAHRNLRGVILSGGPSSVYDEDAPDIDPEVFKLEVPVLGICYGMQLIISSTGGAVEAAKSREYGRVALSVHSLNDPLFRELAKKLFCEFTVWMSHGDLVKSLPPEFESLAATESCPYAAIRHLSLPFYGLQFHPEVHHTTHGSKMLRNFLYSVCNCAGDWKMGDYAHILIQQIRKQVRDDSVICGLSGGVDSSVTAVLLQRAIGERLACIFIDNGLLRKGEAREVREQFGRHFDIGLHFVDASERFIAALAGVTDPEKKRKIIGGLFIDVFKEEAQKISDARYLAQGTLYPDVIESTNIFGGPTSVIKSHHNVGGLPEELGFELIEPLKFLLKDEVRRLGAALDLPSAILKRHPFPGPGLAVRILGEVTHERLEILQAADAILVEEIKSAGVYDDIWQALCVFLPVRSVGVMGDARTYQSTIAIRAVTSTDGMTADWYRMDGALMERIASRIVREVPGVNRVVYDLTTKPPATIEWE